MHKATNSGIGLVTDTDDIPARLKFLYMLRDRTVFSQHATLEAIISDYERTLRLRRTLREEAEAENNVKPRGRPPKTTATGAKPIARSGKLTGQAIALDWKLPGGPVCGGSR